MFEPLAIYDDNWTHFGPMSPEEEKAARQHVKKEQQQSFMDIFRRKLEDPKKPMLYKPDYDR